MLEGRSWSERRTREIAAQAPAVPPRSESTLTGQILKVRRVNDGNNFFVAKILGFDQGFVKLEVQQGQYSTTIGLQGGERLWIPVPQIREFAEIVEPPPVPAALQEAAVEEAEAAEIA
jgi:hypothetical protein